MLQIRLSRCRGKASYTLERVYRLLLLDFLKKCAELEPINLYTTETTCIANQREINAQDNDSCVVFDDVSQTFLKAKRFQ
jgi:hypothetical protein